MKIEIKCRFEGKILFSHEQDDNSISVTVQKAVELNANLYGANLDGANLEGANLVRASLYGASLVRANLYGASLYGANLVRANLDGANLDGASLVRANLDGASLVRANLYGASLVRANLDGANLGGANLDGANLYGASLVRANLDGANLGGANLDGASLVRANLDGASLDGASLDGAKNYDFLKHTIVPQEGAFVGFKKVCTDEGKKVIRVLIPENAKRVGGVVGRKCRAEFVQMLEDVDGWSDYDSRFKYKFKTGDIVKPDSFCDSLFKECEAGIHFFITRVEAENY